MPPSRLLAIGGAHIDRRGRSTGPFTTGVSNPGTMSEEAGGAAFNTARAAVRLGMSASILSARGGDAAGQNVATAIAAAGIADLSSTFLDRTTPSYTALLDRDGEMVAALADMALYETAFDRVAARSATRKAIADADAVLLDTNIPAGALAELATLAVGKPIYANAISPAKAPRLASALPRLAAVFMNAREAAALSGMQEADTGEIITALRAAGLKAGVITCGSKTVAAFDEAGAFSIAPPKIAAADVTGAGDALAGATIAGLMRGLPLAEAIRQGTAAAALVVESASAAAQFTIEVVRQKLQSVPQPVSLALPG